MLDSSERERSMLVWGAGSGAVASAAARTGSNMAGTGADPGGGTRGTLNMSAGFCCSGCCCC